MTGYYFRFVPIGEKESSEPVQYVGVHPMRWHRRPAQPTAGFTPVDDEIKVLRDQRRELRERLNQIYQATDAIMGGNRMQQNSEVLFNTIVDIDHVVRVVLEITAEDPLARG